MQEYMIRLYNYEGAVVDGIITKARNKAEALVNYTKIHPTAVNDMTIYDHISIEQSPADLPDFTDPAAAAWELD